MSLGDVKADLGGIRGSRGVKYDKNIIIIVTLPKINKKFCIIRKKIEHSGSYF